MPFLTLPPNASAPATTIHYKVWGESGAPVLMLIHELGGSLETFREFAELLSRDFKIIAFDQRGAGLSEKTLVPLSLAELADDIARFINCYGFTGRFHLGGLAMGALTALKFASRNVSQIASLLLIDGTSHIDEPTRKYLLDSVITCKTTGARPIAEQMFKNAFRGLPNSSASSPGADYFHRLTSNCPISLAAHLEALAGSNRSEDFWRRLEIPVLVLTGEKDSIWDVAAGETLAAKLPGSQFYVIEGSGHLPPVQNPESLARQVQQFLQNL
jgi:3-oxoadipate enol-lactonase